MTGVEFYQILQETTGHDYSAYFDPARANEIIKEAFIKAIEIKYADLTSEKNSDELAALIKTKVPVTFTGNQIALSAIPQYLHTLALQTNFAVPVDAKITDATNAKPVVLSLDKITNLRDGDQVGIAGVQGNTAANGVRYLRHLYDDFSHSKFTFQLYSDLNTVVPVAGNGAYTKGGVITKTITAWTKKKDSYRKYSNFNESTPNDPYYELAQGLMKVLPDTASCPTGNLDYISVPPVYPDVLNDTINLENTFPLRFLYFWKDEAGRLMGFYSRDNELSQGEQSEIINQP